MCRKYMDKVTVIVPVYNAEKFISDGIKSVLNQNYENIELILINDGSLDNSLEIIKFWEQKYPNIIKVYNKKNSGVGKTRNFGIKKATGKYITFLDADDYLDEDFISQMVKMIGDNDIIIGGYNQVDLNHNIVFTRKILPNELSKFRQMVIWAKLYRSKFLIDNHIIFNDLKVGEDITFSLDTYINTSKVKCTDYSGYNNVSNDFSVTKNMDLKKDLDINGLIKNLCIKSIKGNFIEQNKKQLEFFFLKLFTNYLYDKSRVLNYRELEKYYKEGINFIKDFYQKHDMNFSIMYNKTEPFNINLAINIVIMSYKLKFSKILLKILIRKFHVK